MEPISPRVRRAIDDLTDIAKLSAEPHVADKLKALVADLEGVHLEIEELEASAGTGA